MPPSIISPPHLFKPVLLVLCMEIVSHSVLKYYTYHYAPFITPHAHQNLLFTHQCPSSPYLHFLTPIKLITPPPTNHQVFLPPPPWVLNALLRVSSIMQSSSLCFPKQFGLFKVLPTKAQSIHAATTTTVEAQLDNIIIPL